MYSNKRLAISFMSLVSIAIISTSVWATTIKLLAEPKDGAAVTGTVDPANGIIPIYTPEKSEWIKIADPTNGNTGWIKRNQLTDSQGNVLTVQQNIKNSKDSNSQSMEMTYGNQQLSPEQMKKLQSQQKAAQEAMKAMEQNMDEIKKLYMKQLEMIEKTGVPVFPKAPGQTQPSIQSQPNAQTPPNTQMPTILYPPQNK